MATAELETAITARLQRGDSGCYWPRRIGGRYALSFLPTLAVQDLRTGRGGSLSVGGNVVCSADADI